LGELLVEVGLKVFEFVPQVRIPDINLVVAVPLGYSDSLHAGSLLLLSSILLKLCC
jgi:hypothetical protein